MLRQVSLQSLRGLAVAAALAVASTVSSAQNAADRPQRGDAFLIYRETRVALPGGKMRLLAAGTWGRAVAIEGPTVVGIVNGAKLSVPLANVACGRSGVARLSAEIRDRPTDWSLYLYRADLRRKLKDYDAALEDVAAIPEDASEYPSRMVYLGVIKRDQENWQGAVDDLSAALELATAARDRRAMAYIHLYRGPAYYRLDKLDAAIDDIDEAIKLGYDDAEVHLWRGKLLVQKGQTDLAFEAFKKAKELDPYDKEVRAALVQLYERLNLYGLATDELNELAKDDTNEPAVLWTQARIHYKSKRYDEALAVAEKLLEIEPDHVGARVCQARIYFAKGDKRSLERIALRLMALKLDNGGDFAQRGFCLDACGLTVDAMKDFDQAIALGYRDSSVHTCRAQIHARRSEWEKVVAEATAAIKLDARNKDAYYARGVGLLWLKKTDEGVADFDRAIRIEPNFVRALVARALTFANTN